MSYTDKVFKGQLENLMLEGCSDEDYKVRPVWEGGESAYTRYTSHVFGSISPHQGVPIQTIRRIPWKSALREILAIYQKHATTVEEFKANSIHWWDPWFNQEGNLGTSYSYQLKKEIDFPEGRFTQFDRVLWLLKNNPMDRRKITNMLNLEELVDMELPPCAFMTIWEVRGEYLDLMLVQRSGDAIPAAGFGGVNTIQYYFLLAMVAQVSNYKIGKLTHVISNYHIYDKHLQYVDPILRAKEYESPRLWINPDIKNFYDFTEDDIQLIDYNYNMTIKDIPIAI